MKSDGPANSADPVITFDKEDEDTLDFVAAAANLRSIVFGIETKSRFDIKQMAGNIIPAIATTNAIIAGLCVLQAFKVLRGDFSSAKEVRKVLFHTKLVSHHDRYSFPHSHHSDYSLRITTESQLQSVLCVALHRLVFSLTQTLQHLAMSWKGYYGHNSDTATSSR